MVGRNGAVLSQLNLLQALIQPQLAAARAEVLHQRLAEALTGRACGTPSRLNLTIHMLMMNSASPIVACTGLAERVVVERWIANDVFTTASLNSEGKASAELNIGAKAQGSGK